MTLLDSVKRVLKMCGHALTLTVHERLDAMEQHMTATDQALLQANIRLAERLREGARFVVVESPEVKAHPPVRALRDFLAAQGTLARHVLSQTAPAELRPLVKEMAHSGYAWYIVIYGESFYANLPYALPEGPGDVVFFRDFETFHNALNWCSAMLRRAYFRPIR